MLWHKLHAIQRRMYARFRASKTDEEIWNCARRLGKTFLLLVVAFEDCLRMPGARVKFAAQTANDIFETIEPMVEDILTDCPEGARPALRWAKGRIEFRNGSVVKIAGCDNGNYRRLRGQRADLWIIDEGGFVEELEHIADSVLIPQTLTTGGRGIIASTPPVTPGHHFQTRYLIAKANGASAHYTIDDNPLVTPEIRAAFVERQATKKGLSVAEFLRSTTYRREYLAEFVTEQERAVFPEFTEELERRIVRPSAAEPLWVDRYTIMDLGPTKDLTAIHSGIFDFSRQVYRIRRCRTLRQPSTAQIAAAVKELEAEAFGKAHMPATQTFRYMDGNEVLERDLALVHDLFFSQTAKDDKDAAVGAARDWLAAGKVEFEPGATREMVAQCRAAIWNKRRTEFERIDPFGHFDLADTLIYGVRNVIPNVNRLPRYYGIDRDNTAVLEFKRSEDTALTDALGGL